MENHPLAELFPIIEEDFDKLKQSIKDHGQLNPIVLLNKQVLDGRNRLRACEELKIKPQFIEFSQVDSGNPLEYVLALNLYRRHLSPTQKAAVAAKIPGLKWGRPGKDEKERNFALNDLANKFKVHQDTIKAARAVRERGAGELFYAIEQDEIAVSVAKQLLILPERDQIEIALTKDKECRDALIKDAKARAAEQRAKEKTKKADEKDFELKTQKSRLKQNAVTRFSVDDWKKLTKAERAAVVAQGFDSDTANMNKQETDSIEWARHSLNTVTGCLHGCPFCYARDIAERMYKGYGFVPMFHPDRLASPSNIKVPDESKKDVAFKNIFANSMSDLFGQWVPRDWIEATIEMAARNPQWNFLTLTKFPTRAAEFEFPDNWWMGATVDAQARLDNAERIFAKIRCKTKWLSCEPLLTPLTFKRLDLFQWLVIGGASKSTKTPQWIPPYDWVSNLHQQARDAGVRVYHKSNLFLCGNMRVKEFPWAKPIETILPKAFQYLKGMSN